MFGGDKIKLLSLFFSLRCRKFLIMSLKMKPIDFDDIQSIENWPERFELYRVTNNGINDKEATAYYLT